ncbi:MAG: hypothetical protein D9C04_03500 [Nitrosopumilus sp. B06]|nr:MAG: hypothetical protein D9C04_03500 [Nitrosopumilus sp. B06]
MSRPQKPDPDEPLIPGSNHTPALAFADILGMICAAVKAWGHLKGFTFSPKSNQIFDVRKTYDCLALFQELVRGDKNFRVDRPIYLVAVTCNASAKTNDTLRDGYERIAKASNQPMIGYWKSFTKKSYLDAVTVTQFINREDAIMEGKRHGQEFILKIKPDGHFEHIETD